MVSKLLTCVSDTVVLVLPAHVIDDNDPDQRGSNHTAHHHNYNNAHSGPAVLVIPTSITIWWWRYTKIDVATLCSQSIRHDAGVFPSISRSSIYNNKELVGSSKEVAFCKQQRAVIFGPVESGSRAPPSNTLKHSSFTTCHRSVFKWSQEGWSFWKRTGFI